MKYIIILGDGMADYHKGPLGNATPLELANKPHIDKLAKKGTVGLIKTIPDGIKPGSDVANLSVMGYNPKLCYSGRSPLEALSIGVPMADTDITLRTNLVMLSDEEKYEDKTMLDYSSGEITTPESRALMSAIQAELGNDRFRFYGGVSYRHCLVDHQGKLDTAFTPPHDISDRCIGPYLPKGGDAEYYLELMKRSVKILAEHPVNKKRIAEGKHPATSMWFWGAGTKPLLADFSEKYGLKGAMISAVDLLKGIAVGAKMKNYDVENVTGNIDSNFYGKAMAALQAIDDGYDFVYVHMEAPDECGHRGEGQNKIIAVEKVDYVTGIVEEGLRARGLDFTMAILPDHPTPLCTKTHASDPVPYVIYRSNDEKNCGLSYNELNGEKGPYLDCGEALMETMLNKR